MSLKIFLFCLILFFSFNFLVQGEGEDLGLVFTEIMYNPDGSDQNREWLEIFNASNSPIVIDDTWRFNDGSNHALSLINGTSTLLSGELAIIASDAETFQQEHPDFSGNLFDTVMSLTNSSSTLSLLFDGGETLATQTHYESAWGGDGFSLEKIDPLAGEEQDNWTQSIYALGTPGVLYLEPLNNPPIAVAGSDISTPQNQPITFDGSASFDPDNDSLEYFWDFGDGQEDSGAVVEHSYVASGEYEAGLRVFDGELEAFDSLNVSVEQSSAGLDYQYLELNEILANPVGSDSLGEFIEIKNTGPEAIDLNGLKLSDATTRRYAINQEDFEETLVEPGSYFVVYREQSGIALNNDGDDVKIFSPQDVLLQMLSYDGQGSEGEAYAKNISGQWQWTNIPTPGAPNEIQGNQTPNAEFDYSGDLLVGEEIIFDASDSSDPEGEDLEFAWDFGDQGKSSLKIAKHKYANSGDYQVKLTVTDQKDLKAEKTLSLSILGDGLMASSTVFSLRINELMVNPKGPDEEGEWIELFNYGTTTVKLENFKLDDGEKGSAPYRLSGNLEPLNYSVIKRGDSNISLNNTTDKARLLNLKNEVIIEVSYSGAKENYSYAFDENTGDWFWTDEPSPGEENETAAWEITTEVLSEKIGQEITEQEYYSLADVKELEKNHEVLVKGIVTAEPGVLGKNIFYLSEFDEQRKIIETSMGLQVYSSKISLVPKFKTGDLLELRAKVSSAQGEKKINLQGTDLFVSGHYSLPVPEKKSAIDFDPADVGGLFIVEGELKSKKSTNLYLNDGSGETIVSLKKGTGLKAADYEVGQQLAITGILSLVNEDLRLLPRSKSDISRIESQSQLINENAEILDVKEQSQTFLSTFKQEKVKKYLAYGIASMLVILLALFIKDKLIKKAE